MAVKVIFSLQSVSDLQEIGDFIAQDNNRKAIEWVSRLEKLAGSLKELPDRGKSREDLLKGCRSVVFGKYVIFYCRDKSTVQILRVLHSARSIENLLDGF